MNQAPDGDQGVAGVRVAGPSSQLVVAAVQDGCRLLITLLSRRGYFA
jgi:hypothetical protein